MARFGAWVVAAVIVGTAGGAQAARDASANTKRAGSGPAPGTKTLICPNTVAVSVQADAPWKPVWTPDQPHTVKFDHAELSDTASGKRPNCTYLVGNVVLHNFYEPAAGETCTLNADKRSFTCSK